MTWRFSRQLWLYLASAFSFGLAQAFTALASLLLTVGFAWVTLRSKDEEGFDEGFGLALVTALLLCPHSVTLL